MILGAPKNLGMPKQMFRDFCFEQKVPHHYQKLLLNVIYIAILNNYSSLIPSIWFAMWIFENINPKVCWACWTNFSMAHEKKTTLHLMCFVGTKIIFYNTAIVILDAMGKAKV